MNEPSNFTPTENSQANFMQTMNQQRSFIPAMNPQKSFSTPVTTLPDCGVDCPNAVTEQILLNIIDGSYRDWDRIARDCGERKEAVINRWNRLVDERENIAENTAKEKSAEEAQADVRLLLCFLGLRYVSPSAILDHKGVHMADVKRRWHERTAAKKRKRAEMASSGPVDVFQGSENTVNQPSTMGMDMNWFSRAGRVVVPSGSVAAQGQSNQLGHGDTQVHGQGYVHIASYGNMQQFGNMRHYGNMQQHASIQQSGNVNQYRNMHVDGGMDWSYKTRRGGP
jgi:hypothetical protein